MSDVPVIEREWAAPMELVWELWTTAEGFGSWYGPRGFEAEIHVLEPFVGGRLEYTMRATDPKVAAGMEAQGRPSSWRVEGTYTRVETHTALEWSAAMGPETLITSVQFTQAGDRVRMRLTLEAGRPEMAGGAAMGWKSALGRLDERLAARLE